MIVECGVVYFDWKERNAIIFTAASSQLSFSEAIPHIIQSVQFRLYKAKLLLESQINSSFADLCRWQNFTWSTIAFLIDGYEWYHREITCGIWDYSEFVFVKESLFLVVPCL